MCSSDLAIPLRGLEGDPGLPGAPQDEAGLKNSSQQLFGFTPPKLLLSIPSGLHMDKPNFSAGFLLDL